MKHTIHALKTWKEPFQAVWNDRKFAEFRLNDRDFCEGDILFLREYDPATGLFSGSWIKVEVTHICGDSQFGIPENYVMMSFRVHQKYSSVSS